MAEKKEPQIKVVAENRKARFNYAIEDTVEAGVVLTGTAFGCNPYLGDIEVGVAGGDSGGPQFLNGKLASVTSYGLTFGADFGDIDDALNSSFGEFSGYVPIYAHEDWLKSVVPEPATWAMMIAGFGLVGTMMRRRRTAVAA